MKPLSTEFLLSRGVCCGKKCTNCPYFPRATRGAIEIFDVPAYINCYPSCSVKTMQDGLCMCYLDFKEKQKYNDE